MKPRAYIAGPMRGYANYNFDAFDAAYIRLVALGYAVINPADFDRVVYDVDQYLPDSFKLTLDEQERIIRRDIEIILSFRKERGDILYCLSGWQTSVGTQVEIACAHFVGINVYFESMPEPPEIC